MERVDLVFRYVLGIAIVCGLVLVIWNLAVGNF